MKVTQKLENIVVNYSLVSAAITMRSFIETASHQEKVAPLEHSVPVNVVIVVVHFSVMNDQIDLINAAF